MDFDSNKLSTDRSATSCYISGTSLTKACITIMYVVYSPLVSCSTNAS